MVLEFLGALYSSFGLAGLFVAAIIANATIFFPLPIEAIVIALSAAAPSLFSALLLGIAAGAGAGIGETTAYFLGRLGVQAIENIGKISLKKIAEVEKRIRNSGALFILFAAIVPFPFDIVGLCAGLVKFDFKKFFLAVFFGKIIRYILIALASYYGFAAIKGFFAPGHT
jgi:membrane protein YqaA with SNARE-associated domain